MTKKKIIELAGEAKLREWAKVHKEIAKKILNQGYVSEYVWKQAAKLSRELEELAIMGNIEKEKIDQIKNG